MTEKQEEPELVSESGSEIGVLIGGLLLAVGLLYVGGWAPIWEQPMIIARAFIIDSHGFAIGFNELYYGAKITNRFFDSPVISWLCFMLAFGLTPVGFVFFGNDD